MTYVARLFEGSMAVRMMPVDGPHDRLITPRSAPPRFAAIDPSPPTMAETDTWESTGWSAEGSMTAEEWVRRFGVDLPADTDRTTFDVPVVFLEFRRR